VSALQPHRKRYWLTPPPDDPVELAEQIRTVCEVYEATPTLAATGTHVASTDEMTGIQALERLHLQRHPHFRARDSTSDAGCGLCVASGVRGVVFALLGGCY
jgi:hypothetical protein